MFRLGIAVTLAMAIATGGAMASRIVAPGGTDYGGAAPRSYYWQGDYTNEAAYVQDYETLGPDYGPDSAAPSTNADGVRFLDPWVPGQVMRVEWDLNVRVAGDYREGEYFNLWKDLNQNGLWDEEELIFKDHRTPDITGWSTGIYTFSGSFIDPVDAEPGWTWVHTRLSYGVDVATSPSLAVVSWEYGESEDYPVRQTPEPSIGLLLLVGLLPLHLALKRRRPTTETHLDP